VKQEEYYRTTATSPFQTRPQFAGPSHGAEQVGQAAQSHPQQTNGLPDRRSAAPAAAVVG